MCSNFRRTNKDSLKNWEDLCYWDSSWDSWKCRGSTYFLNKVEEKVIPIVGNFDVIKLEDKSIHFIVEFDSLHHSFDLNKTTLVSARILKPGARLLAINRTHWSTSRKRRNELESTVYSEKFLTERGWIKILVWLEHKMMSMSICYLST